MQVQILDILLICSLFILHLSERFTASASGERLVSGLGSCGLLQKSSHKLEVFFYFHTDVSKRSDVKLAGQRPYFHECTPVCHAVLVSSLVTAWSGWQWLKLGYWFVCLFKFWELKLA